MRKINQRMGNNDQLLELCDKDGEVLRDLNTYIPNLVKYLIIFFQIKILGFIFI